MWSSAKDKNELNEKTKQIHILNEIIQMNSKQALSQKSTIEKLKKDIEEEKQLANALLVKNIKLQENSDNILLKLEILRKRYKELKEKFNDLQGKYNTILLNNLVPQNQDNSILATSFCNNNNSGEQPASSEFKSPTKVGRKKGKALSITNRKQVGLDSVDNQENSNFRPLTTRVQSVKDLSFPDLNLISHSLDEKKPSDDIHIVIRSPLIDNNTNDSNESSDSKLKSLNTTPQHIQHLSHFSKFPKDSHHIESLDDISEKESASIQNSAFLPCTGNSLNAISDCSKSREIAENGSSMELKDINRKKPNLHIFTQNHEKNPLFFNKGMKLPLDKKNSTQYFEDLGSSVVALKYESFLSPFQPCSSNKKGLHMKKPSNFSIKPQVIECKTTAGDTVEAPLPITFLPLASPHLGNNVLKFSKFFRKIKEEDEEMVLSEEKLTDEKLKNQIETKINQENHQNLSKGSSENREIECSKKCIFEEFLVIGLDKKDFEMDKNVENVNDGFFPAKILYFFDGDSKPDIDCPRKRIIHEFAFPYGVPFKKLTINKSFGALNQIAFSYNPNEICKRAFIFTMRSEEYYNKNNDDPFLNILNPDRILYCICIIKKDYLETTKEDHVFIRKNRKQRKFWITKKIYCFVTYFPFFKLFIEILEDIMNKIKFKRLEQYTMNRTEEHEILKKIDISIVTEILNSEIMNFLAKIQKTPLPKYGENYQINGLIRENITYELPTTDLAEYEEAKWGAALAFSNLSLDDFLFVFFSLLLEKKVVIVSKDIALLTGTIQTFFSLMRPFTWPHPLIFNLPESLFPLLDSPVPFIFGINQSSEFLFKYNLNIDEKDKIMFVCLDENKIFYSAKKFRKLLKLIPQFQNFRSKISPIYKEFNHNGPHMIDKALISRMTENNGTLLSPIDANTNNIANNKKNISRNLIYNPNKEEEIKCKKIFEYFRRALEDISMNILPKEPIFYETEAKVLNIDYIAEKLQGQFKNAFDEIYLHKFYKTQLFAFWLEKFYEL